MSGLETCSGLYKISSINPQFPTEVALFLTNLASAPGFF